MAVCGLGKVGTPILNMLRGKHLRAVGYDCDPRKTQSTLPECVIDSDTCIFIVQTPSLEDGSFDNSYLLGALTNFSEEVKRQGKPNYLYIVGSTTVPGSCEQFREIVGDNICYKPEFIRLEYVDADLLSPSFTLIGSCAEEAAYKCEEIYRTLYGHVPVRHMSLTEAELAKITLNCALTMKISLSNQLHMVARRMGCDSAKIMDVVGLDPRIGHGHMKPGWPYAGPCLPRDNRMFRFVAQSVGIDACLSEAADKINKMVGG